MEATKFSDLGLAPDILRGVEALGFDTPTPVQEAAIPLVLAGRDVVASAQTGTGKTAAFTLPLLQRLEPGNAENESESNVQGKGRGKGNVQGKGRGKNQRKGPRALIVTPTRELAQQIEHVCEAVCAVTGHRVTIVTGGAKFGPQLDALERGVDVLVATPGRLLDLMERKAVRLDSVRILVLDEADRMLDMGFWPSVRQIVHACPTERQTLLFSATIPPSIQSTVDAMLHDPALVEIAHIGETAETVEEALLPVVQGQKTQLLEQLMSREHLERVLVFCGTKARVDQVAAALRRRDLSVAVMHADRSQKDRERALARFKAGKVQVLVATDVMSRGIDVSGIDAVVNFDVPKDPEDYVHRIGRTGRAGAVGHAYTFVAPDEMSPLREIEYFTKTRIPTQDLEGFEYAEGRIVPGPNRPLTKTTRTMFRGSRSRGFGPAGGRYGRHT